MTGNSGVAAAVSPHTPAVRQVAAGEAKAAAAGVEGEAAVSLGVGSHVRAVVTKFCFIILKFHFCIGYKYYTLLLNSPCVTLLLYIVSSNCLIYTFFGVCVFTAFITCFCTIILVDDGAAMPLFHTVSHSKA